MKPIIKIENLSKQYRLGTIGTGTLTNDLKRWWYLVRGKEDPFLKIGDSNDRSIKGDSDYVWALHDINLEVMPGEVLGIIGKNGAGKSTLLKILSKVTGPTTGSISFNGRIGSLLEVGTGFHPELTGRENIFLNGAILGMTKPEIRSKLDEIIDFSGCERYIDTPVKRYSSGMTVRLGFAVAAHLEPEILVVDEVLAVGDAEFQKKAIGKMQDVSKNDGRTVLFVSHNMGAINNLCQKALLLEKGTIAKHGNVQEIIDYYLSSGNNASHFKKWDNLHEAPGNDHIKIIELEIINERNEQLQYSTITDKVGIRICYHVRKEQLNFSLGINLYSSSGMHLLSSHEKTNSMGDEKIKEGVYCSNVWLPANLLQPGDYYLSIALMRYSPFEIITNQENILKLSLIDSRVNSTRPEDCNEHIPGVVRPKLDWERKLI